MLIYFKRKKGKTWSENRYPELSEEDLVKKSPIPVGEYPSPFPEEETEGEAQEGGAKTDPKTTEVEKLRKELFEAQQQLELQKQKFVDLEKDKQEVEEKLKRIVNENQDNLERLGKLRLKLFKIDDTELKLGDIVGRGSYGAVFASEWTTKRIVAVKQVQLSVQSHDSIIQEFQHHVSLVHPSILRIYGYSEPDPHCVRIIMEKMDMNLQTYLFQKRPPFEQKIEIMKKMIDGLHFLHHQTPKLLHRDIKSMNFLCSEDGKEVKITDFGFTRTMESSKSYVQSEERGTPYWMAPEIQKYPASEYSVGSDIYSLAITFWEVLHESEPYSKNKGVNRHNVRDAVVMHHVRPTLDPNLPEEFADLLKRMWDKDRKNRPDTNNLKRWFHIYGDMLKQKYKDFIPQK